MKWFIGIEGYIAFIESKGINRLGPWIFVKLNTIVGKFKHRFVAPSNVSWLVVSLKPFFLFYTSVATSLRVKAFLVRYLSDPWKIFNSDREGWGNDKHSIKFRSK